MNNLTFLALACALLPSPVPAQSSSIMASLLSQGTPFPPSQPASSPISSSTSLHPALLSSSQDESPAPAGDSQPEPRPRSNRPFHGLALAGKVGTGGIGFEVATPLSNVISLRSGAQFFDYTAAFNSNGIHSLGDITLQNVSASVDIFPFQRSSFHISPGVTLHNDNHVTSTLTVPGGQTFSLGNTDYISDPNDPVNGIARLRFGNTVAPRLTVGAGRMLPRTGSRLSFPFEAGFQYISQPTARLYLGGSGCDQSGSCGNLGNDDSARDIHDEEHRLEQVLHPLQFFPILSFGVSLRMGH